MPKTKIRRRSKTAASPWGKAALIFVIILVGGLVLVGGVIGTIVWIKHHKSDKKDDFVDSPVTDPGDPPMPREPLTSVVPQFRGQDPLQPSPQMRQLLNELDFKDPGWRLGDLERARAEIPLERNGAVYALHCFDLMGERKFNENARFDFPAPHQTLSKDERKNLVDELGKFSSVIGQARKLARFPEGRFRLVWSTSVLDTKLKHLSYSAILSRILVYDGLRLAEKGDSEKCLDNIRALINLSHYYREEPGAIAVLTRIIGLGFAVNLLENLLARKTDLSDDSLADMESLLLKEIDWPDMYHVFRGERGWFHADLTNRTNGDVPWPGNPINDNDHRVWLSLMTRLVEWSRTPPKQPDPIFAQIESDILSSPENVRKIFIAASKIHLSVAKVHTRVRTAVAALRAERYRLKNGSWPKDLGADCPVDAWAGQPLKLAVQSQGITIYAVIDAPDSGGDFDRINKHEGATNIGFRLLDPDKRK
jgi:hypothetical protein